MTAAETPPFGRERPTAFQAVVVQSRARTGQISLDLRFSCEGHAKRRAPSPCARRQKLCSGGFREKYTSTLPLELAANFRSHSFIRDDCRKYLNRRNNRETASPEFGMVCKQITLTRN